MNRCIEYSYSNTVGAPEFLDTKFFKEAIENALLLDDIRIRKVHFEMGSQAGENYCSRIFRVRLTFEYGTNKSNTTTVIIKCVEKLGNSNFLEDMRVYLKERAMYTNTLLRLETLSNKTKFGPTLYHVVKEPVNTFVFEDLMTLAYKMANRENGLDIMHCELVMKKLGQLHGTSVILHEKDPKSMTLYTDGMLSEKILRDSDFFHVYCKGNMKGLISAVEKWKGYESVAKQLNIYLLKMNDILLQAIQPLPGEFKVLNHGDLWVNNMLFKYSSQSNNQPEDVRFVDFQLSRFGSPGFDLNYFFYTSLPLDILKDKREHLLSVYYDSLREVLSAHRYKTIPTFKDILLEVRQRESYGFFAHYVVFPPVAMDKSQCADNSIENFLDKNIIKKKIEIMFSSKRVEDTMRYTLKKFEELGVLG